VYASIPSAAVLASVLPTVLFVGMMLAGVVGVMSLAARKDIYDDIGRGPLSIDREDGTPADSAEPSSCAPDAHPGAREEAQRELGILKSRSESQYVSPMSFAAIYAGLGEDQETLSHLQRAVDSRDTALPLHLLSAEFDGLRNHPQFHQLHGRIGLLEADFVQGGAS